MFKAYLKRIFLFFPFVMCYLLAFGFAALCIVTYGDAFLFKDKTSVSATRLVCYMPDDTSANELGLSLVSRIDSVKETVIIDRLDTVDEVYSAIEEGEAIAGVIIPEGFIDSVFTGENMQATVVFRTGTTFMEHAVNDLILTLSNLLGTGQGIIRTGYQYVNEAGDLPGEAVNRAMGRLSEESVSYVLGRNRLFDNEDQDALQVFTLREKMTASYSTFLLMMSVFVFAFFYKGNKESFMARARLAGYSRFRIFLIETLSVSFMMYALYLIMFAALRLVKINLNPGAVILMLPVIILLSAIMTGLCYLLKKPTTVAFTGFGGGLIIMYAAGGLIPLEYMSKFFSYAAPYNPMYYVINYSLEVMFG